MKLGWRELGHAVRQGIREGWRDEMRDGWKGFLHRFYVEPFVLLWQFAKRAVTALKRR